MDRSKKGRAPIRVIFTRTINEILAETSKQEPNKDVVNIKYEKLEKVVQQLREFDDKIKELLVDDEHATEEQIQKEHDSIYDYEEQFISITNKVHAFKYPSLPNTPVASEAGATSALEMKKAIKLPKIELKQFNGELTEWLGWWAQFSKIHNDESLHDVDKFQYLVQSMKPGTRAKRLIESYPLTSENYLKALEALKDRFGDKVLLTEIYVRQLLKLVIVNVGKRGIPLESMYDKLESHLRSLDTLGVTADQSAAFLYPLVESSLPEEVIKVWQRSPLSGYDDEETEKPVDERLKSLMKFLKREVKGAERLAYVQAGFSEPAKSRAKQISVREKHTGNTVPTAAGLFGGQIKSCCLFCQKPNHNSQDCLKAQNMSLNEKTDLLKSKKACFLCCKIGHGSRQCKSMMQCLMCAKRHYTIMCPDLPGHKMSPQPSKPEVAETSGPTNRDETSAHLTNQVCMTDILLQTQVVNLKGPKGDKVVKLMYDTGSQRSYIRKTTAEALQLKPIGQEYLKKALFGGKVTPLEKHSKYKISLESLDGSKEFVLEVLEEKVICDKVPGIPPGPWMQELNQREIYLNDKCSRKVNVEILIGSDYYGDFVTGNILKLKSGLTAIETIFGWTLCGKLPTYEQSAAYLITSMLMMKANISELWDLETIGIRDPCDVVKRDERDLAVKKRFRDTILRCKDGRYSIALPWIGVKDIPNNRDMAKARLKTTTDKLKRMGQFENYEAVLWSWQEEGITETVDDDLEHSPCHFLPHRAVIKPQSTTTPLRPVFDASCKKGREPSLNDCLEKGPNLMELLPEVLLRFREKQIGVVSDIRKAFQMIEVQEQDRDFLRFYWWKRDQPDQLLIFRHKRVVFGLNCSPFLLAAVLDFHLDSINDERRPLALKLLKSLYVDNCVTSVDSLEELDYFKSTSMEIMAEAQMELRQWESGYESLYAQYHASNMEREEKTTVLGIIWDKSSDTLTCDIPLKEPLPEKVTKRVVLSQVQKIFDPLGFWCPVLLTPKLLLQQTWIQKLSWDEEIQGDLYQEFKTWMSQVDLLKEVRIPRSMSLRPFDGAQIHTFCDASQYAYATAIFLRSIQDGKVNVRLLRAKARVAPLKKITIPRLELLACTLGARLTKCTVTSLTENYPIYFWSDSTTALTWVKQNNKWGTFVGNRVLEICQLTNANDWHHIPGRFNPADLPSRGCTAQQFLNSRWWEGPSWLFRPEDEWPTEPFQVNEDEVNSEIRKTSLTQMSLVTRHTPWYVTRFSSYQTNLRIMAWIRRFIAKSRKQSFETDELTVSELVSAERCLFGLIQAQTFPSSEPVICGLRVSRNRDGLICVDTKLLHRQDTESFRKPILLPHSHPLVDQLILEEHLKHGHAGVQFLMSKLRERCWIVQGRKAIRRKIRTCVVCQRYTSKPMQVSPAPLPEDRIKSSKVFEITGIDLAGPLFLKDGNKTWVVLFTCAVFRAVHLELVTSLETNTFLLALHRFISRRGRPSTIYSDNGTNFVGAVNLFKSLDWKKIQRETSVRKIQWKFIPPTAAWWGGWWERLIQTLKNLLRRMLGHKKLNYYQLETCLCEVEAVINGRPLTYVTEDQDDLIPLTPAMFLQDQSDTQFPELENLTSKDFRKHYKDLKKLKSELQLRFRSEYLGLLVQQGKKENLPDIKVGDVILVGYDNLKRIHWPMARVLELLPGKDQKVRVAKVKTASGVLIRPLQRLYPMEVPEDDFKGKLISRPKLTEGNSSPEDEKSQDSELTTRSGRRVKKPVHFGH